MQAARQGHWDPAAPETLLELGGGQPKVESGDSDYLARSRTATPVQLPLPTTLSDHSTPRCVLQRPSNAGKIRNADRSGYLAAAKLDCCRAEASRERLCRGRRRGSSPFNGRQRDHHDCDNEQSNNNHPLNRSIVLIWIPTGHELDPIRKYWSDERQQTGYCCQANFNPEQTSKMPSHMKLPELSTAPALDSRHA
jgi:hypothetical protein